jgi:hypothetical protein
MRVTLNPTFSIETGELLSHDGQFDVAEIPILFDRAAQGQANQNRKTDLGIATGAGSEASQIGSSVIPGLERDVNNPTGFTPVEKNRQLVAGAEAIGGVNAGVKGEANLASARTRTAGGFAPALDEAARIKSRQLSSNALGVENEDAMLRQKKQQEARGQLLGVMGSDRANQLRAMGLSDEAIQAELAAGRQGWFQNTMEGINTVVNAARGPRV